MNLSLESNLKEKGNLWCTNLEVANSMNFEVFEFVFFSPKLTLVKNLQPLLNKDPHLNQIFSTPPLISYHQPLTSNFYSHLPPYQMNISSRAPFPANLLNAISAPT